jgi:hypothetical protein
VAMAHEILQNKQYIHDAGTFRQQKTFSTDDGSFPYAMDSGDFNRNKIQDLIVANSGTHNIGILL